MQITGLASGLDTNAIVHRADGRPAAAGHEPDNQQTGLTAMNTQLTSIQTALQKVATDAQALGNPSLFALTQTISSTNSTLVGATATSSNGAVVGGYQVSVSALASASQKTFSFTSPTSADTVTIDGQQISLAAGAPPMTSSARSTPTRTWTCGRPPPRSLERRPGRRSSSPTADRRPPGSELHPGLRHRPTR